MWIISEMAWESSSALCKHLRVHLRSFLFLFLSLSCHHLQGVLIQDDHHTPVSCSPTLKHWRPASTTTFNNGVVPKSFETSEEVFAVCLHRSMAFRFHFLRWRLLQVVRYLKRGQYAWDSAGFQKACSHNASR